MAQALSIWSRVILAELNKPQKIKQQSIFTLDSLYQSLEDVKIKLKNYYWCRQGQAVEAVIKLDVLLLLEERDGRMQLVRQEETLRDRIPFSHFDSNVEGLDKEKKIDFNGDIQNLAWQGDLMGNELYLTFMLEYMVVATREQVVKLSEQGEAELGSTGQDELLQDLEGAIVRMENENHELRRQIFLYERDISSLKKGIRKVENRNAFLNSESRQYQELSEKLQAAIREKEMRLKRYENPYYQSSLPNEVPLAGQKEELLDPGLSLGSRVKRMFMNSY